MAGKTGTLLALMLLACVFPLQAQDTQEGQDAGTVAPAGICMDCPDGLGDPPGPVNIPPAVSLDAPAANQAFVAGTAVSLAATAYDPDDGVKRVEFLIDGTEVAQDTSSPYAANWTATSGSHTVQARAVDNRDLATTTPAITITAGANQSPSVSLTAPSNGAQLTAGATVALKATASDSDGSVDRVEFLVDGSEIGQDTSSPYSRSWTVQPGSHTIQARAVDDLGKTKTTSAITVQGVMAPVTASATRQYVYNQYQQLCKVIEPETGATLMGYDAAGNLAWSATGLPTGTACDLEGDTAAILARKAVRTYDARNRITALEFADGKADVDYTYTPAGQLATIAAANGGGNNVVTTSYTYNRRGLLVHEGQLLAGSSWSHDWTIDYAYDPNGHLSQQTVHAYGAPHAVAYAPNALGQPTQAGSYATGVSYYPNGAMKQFTYGNGIVHTLTRNVRGLPDRSLDAYGSTKFLDDGYDYDANGNVAAISDGATGRNQRGNRTMSYDGLDRLTAVESPMYGTTGTAYGYDSLDNLVRVVAPGRDHHYCYDANNRLTSIRTGSCSGTAVTSLGYDVQGNLASKGGVAYTFDQGNRLRAVSSPASIYLYDGHGRRVRDASPDSRYSVYSQSGQLVFDYNKRDITYNWYVHLNGSLVATRTRNYDTGVEHTRYQHTDALGSPVVVTNESRTVVKRNEYEPYGKLVGASIEDGPGYTGHMADAATGLVYMQQRYYDPTIDGRFLSVDPVTANSPGGTFNRYWYANANPYKFTDPDGRLPCEVCKELANEARGVVARFAAEKTVAFISALIDEGKAALHQGLENAREFVRSRDVVITAGLTGMAGAPIAGNSIAMPAVQVTGNVSVVANLSRGQIGIQASGGPMGGVGGGAVLSPEVGIGLSKGPLETGLSQSNTAYAQVSAVTATGVPVDVGGSVNWSNNGESVSVGLRAGVGTYIGAGGGQVLTGTMVTPPLREPEN